MDVICFCNSVITYCH